MEFKKDVNSIDETNVQQGLKNQGIEEVRFNILAALKSLVNTCKAKIKRDLQELFRDDFEEQVESVQVKKIEENELDPRIESWLIDYMSKPSRKPYFLEEDIY